MRGLLELAVVFTFVIGWAVVELVALWLDKRRVEQQRAEQTQQPSQTEKQAPNLD